MRKFFLFFVMLFTAVAMNAQNQTFYLQPNDDWKSNGARFALYTMGDAPQWYDMTVVADENGAYYEAEIPGSVTQVIFCRMDGATTVNNWDNKWNQTQDMLIEEGKDLCKITDWNAGTWGTFTATPWVGGSNDKLKVFKNGTVPNVVNIQKPGWAAEDGIYMTFPSAAWDKSKFSLPARKYAIDGAGMVIYLSALDLKYNEISINCNNTDYPFTVYNVDGDEVMYNVAGSSVTAFGTTWDEYANKMTLNEGAYKWEKEDLSLAAGTITFKVVKNHNWSTAWPASDYALSIPAAGIYTITITYNPEGNVVNAVATKTGEAVVLPEIKLHGNFSGSWVDSEAFDVAEGNLTASLTMTLAVGNYEFGVKKDGTWTANGAAFTRESPSAVVESGSNNLTLNADKAGDYTFTWTFASNTLDVDYPGCHWNELSWLNSSDATYANQFKVCVGDPAPGVDIIQKPGFASEIGIYMTFPSAVWDKSKFSLTESQYAIQGAGMVIYLSAFSAKETEVTIGCDNKLFEFAVYNAKGTTPSTAIDNTNVAEKAQKFVENGQLFIRRDGKIYTTTGVQVK